MKKQPLHSLHSQRETSTLSVNRPKKEVSAKSKETDQLAEESDLRLSDDEVDFTHYVKFKKSINWTLKETAISNVN